jgi:SAM-dependent methyltransferase
VTAVWERQGALAGGVGDTDIETIVETFNIATLWRYEAIVRLGLTGDSLAAAASPSPVIPQLLDFLVRNVAAAPGGTVLDVGAGLAGFAETIRRSLGRPVVAFDASRGTCSGARRLFPDVLAARAHPAALPVGTETIAAAISCGLLSVLGDPDQLMVEARRVTKPAGRFVVIDLASATSSAERVGSSIYLPAERILTSLVESGFDVIDEAVGLTSLSDWALADDEIARDVARRRRGESEFAHWLDDRRRLERVMSSDRVVMVAFAATPR